MATNLDLEEQEQLDQLKHFWQQWGNAISTCLAVVALAYLAYTSWNYWQRHQAAQATVLFDTVERAQKGADLVLMERAVADIKDKFGRTVYASQAALLLAQVLLEKDRQDDAQTQLQWAVDHGADAGYQTIARLRLSALLIDKKQNEAARQLLSATVPVAYQPLVQDRLGDLALLEGKKSDAIGLYQNAWRAMDPRAEYRRLLEIKLASLGVEPKAQPTDKP
jgi:predicted negative regulator of RcsB-dependent stress response